MIVLMIIAIVMSLATPALERMIANNRLANKTSEFFASLVMARSEALKRNQRVSVCKSANAATCTGAGNWEQGWIIYVDEDADGAQDADEPGIYSGDALFDGYTLRSSSAGLSDQVSFFTDGSASAAGTFVMCDKSADVEFAREVRLTITGRPMRYRSAVDCGL